MPIQKVFAIKAGPHEIYAALQRDLASAEREGDQSFEVLRRDPGRALELRVSMGGVSCWLTYELKPSSDSETEITATLTPFGAKYTLFKIMTLGLRDHAFALALVQGLANLKAEVEGVESIAGEDGADGPRG
ncbi:MAG: hypothetical protein M3P30_15940 [Chloroflexota bacterium]|nr:hypothetical protein [Chloroflexota bacterium]